MRPEMFSDLNLIPLQFVLSSLTVVVEDSASSCSVTVKVFPRMTTAALKQQVSHEKKTNSNISSTQSNRTLHWNHIYFTTFLPPEDVFRLRLSPTSAALGDWPVSVRWPALTGFIRGASGRRHSLPVPPGCPSRSLVPSSFPTGPGECPALTSSNSDAPDLPHTCSCCKRSFVSGAEALCHLATKTPQQQHQWWVEVTFYC